MISPIKISQIKSSATQKLTAFGKKAVQKISTSSDITNLKLRWEDTLSRLDIPRKVITNEFDNFVNAYNSPKRGYHGLTHVQNMLKEADEFRINNPKKKKEGKLMDFAIFMHDIINGEANDVEKSVGIARNILSQSSSSKIRAKQGLLEEMIMVTKHDGSVFKSASTEAKVIADADLAILGANETLYNQYAAHIRNEHSKYPDDVFAEGRTKILKSFLEKPQIYATDYFKNKYETSARQNIAGEIEKLARKN